MRSRRFARALIVALFAHAALLAAVHAYVRPVDGRAPPPLHLPVELELEEPADAPTLEPPRAPLQPAPAVEATSRRAPAPIDAAPAAREDEVAPSAAPDPGWSGAGLAFRPAAQGPVDLGLAPGGGATGATAPLASSAPKPWRAPRGPSEGAPASSTGGVAEALFNRDVSLGLGPAGPAVTAAHEVIPRSLAPVDGTATFEVIADASGHVTSIRVSHVSSDDQAWAEAASLLLEAMKARTVRVPRGAKGVSFSLHVSSRLQTATGSDARKILPPAARIAMFPLKVLSGRFDVTDLAPSVYRVIGAWEDDVRPL